MTNSSFVRRDGSTIEIDHRYLSDGIVAAVVEESNRAHLKHAAHGISIFDPTMPRGEKLTALVEEVGEVARAMTRDDGQGKDHLVKELIQVANVALTWADSEQETDDDVPDGLLNEIGYV